MKTLLATFLMWSLLAATGPTPGTRVANLVGSKYVGGFDIQYRRLPHGPFLRIWVDDPTICRRGLLIRTRQNFRPDAAGRIAICGRVSADIKTSDGNYLSYEFTKAYLVDLKGMPVRLEFITRTVNGVNYRFSGTYFDYPDAKDGVYLQGRMTKFANGQGAPETTLRLAPFRYFE